MLVCFVMYQGHRGGDSTGAAGAFAPVNFQQRVHYNRPDEELPNKWLYFSLKMRFLSPNKSFLSPNKSFLSPERSFLMQKCSTILNFLVVGSPFYP